MYILSIVIILIGSSWSWELLSFNPYLLLLIWSLSILLYLSVIRSSKKFLYIFCLILIPVLIIQFKTTKNARLDYMSPTDENLFLTRKTEASLFNSGLGRYLENKPIYMFNKLEQNLLQSMNLNLYFFGSHPRERSGIREFEKFSFLFLPFFLLGLLAMVKYYPRQLAIGFLIPLLEFSIIGQDNPVGPFSLFPFFAVTIAIGAVYAKRKIVNIVNIKHA